MKRHFQLTRLLTGLVLSLLVSLNVQAGSANSTKLQETRDLKSEAELARQKDVPLLLMFSQRGCSYCYVLEEEYLKPMLRSGDYRNKVLIRKVSIDDFSPMRDFNGESVDADDLAQRYRAYVTPTMVFVDYQGNELTKRIMGVGTEGYFANEVDQAIELSLQRLRAVAINR